MVKPGFMYCTSADDKAVGNCCPTGSADAACTDSGDPTQGIQCSAVISGSQTPAELGILRTFDAGMLRERAERCSDELSIAPTADVATFEHSLDS